MEREEKRGLIGLLIVFLAAAGAAALINGITESATFAWIVFVAIFSTGLFKGDEIARFIGGDNS